jgi:hypothetical protein
MQWRVESCLVAVSDSVEYVVCNPLLDKALQNKKSLESDPEIWVAVERVPPFESIAVEWLIGGTASDLYSSGVGSHLTGKSHVDI